MTDWTSVLFGEQDEMEKLKDFLTYNGIRKSKLSFDEAEQVYELFVDAKEEKQAKTIARVFLEQQEKERTENAAEEEAAVDEFLMPETEEASEEVNPGELLKTASAQGGLTYMNSGAKAEENRSSAWVLLVVGILGMLVMILGITGVLPLNIGNPPLHGPVWRENLGWFIGKYDTWSRYAPEEKGVLIVYASMYGNTENAAQALAARLCDKGMSRVALYDVSSTHVSQLISEAFKYSHIVLASVTYNLGIYPAMHDFLMDMKALNLQNRTFALIENGSWAVKSGDLMQKFVNDELKNMTVLNERLSLASSMGTDKRTELEALADAILESMK